MVKGFIPDKGEEMFLMTRKKLRIAMGQMTVKPGDPHRNLQRAISMIREASAEFCNIIVLPECLDLGWTFPDAKMLAKPIPGEYSDILCQTAKDANIYVVAGLTEKFEDKLFNTAILISPDGVVLNKHRKINELDIAQDLYAIGESLSVVRTSLGIIGINICADNTPSSLVLGHAQARMGAQLLLSPSSWAARPNHDNIKDPYGAMWLQSYKSLAELYEIPVIGVSNVGWIEGGAWNGWKCIGCSLAIGADGSVLAKGEYGHQAEALIPVDCTIFHREEKGTILTEKLAKKGYFGP
jgi:predicted amidohydrolase